MNCDAGFRLAVALSVHFRSDDINWGWRKQVQKGSHFGALWPLAIGLGWAHCQNWLQGTFDIQPTPWTVKPSIKLGGMVRNIQKYSWSHKLYMFIYVLIIHKYKFSVIIKLRFMECGCTCGYVSTLINFPERTFHASPSESLRQVAWEHDSTIEDRGRGGRIQVISQPGHVLNSWYIYIYTYSI